VKSTEFFKSANGNLYFHNSHLGVTMLCHPLLNEAVVNINKSHSSNELFNCQKFDENIGMNYYSQKVLFLAHHKIIDFKVENDSFLRLTSHEIELNFLNTKEIIFEVTEKCNLQCSYCTFGENYNNYDHRNNTNLDVNSAISLLEKLKQCTIKNPNQNSHNKLNIVFFGGEPLMNFSLIKDIVEYSKMNLSIVFNLEFHIITNALLVKKHIEYLLANDIKIRISVDGNESDNIYRVFPNGKSAGNRIVRTIDYLKAEYQTYFLNNVSFNSVLHHKNSITGIYSFLKTRYDKVPRIAEIHKEGMVKILKNQTPMINTFSSHENKEEILKSGAFRSIQDYSQLSIFVKNSLKHFCIDDLRFKLHSKIKKIPTGTCIPFSKIYVTARGKILPCESVGYQFKLGEIVDGEIQIDFSKVADQYNLYFEIITKKCSLCFNVHLCNKCLFLIDRFPDKTHCHDFRDQTSFRDKLSQETSILEINPSLYWDFQN